MSLILEALKKAERQHKLGDVPGIGIESASTAQTGLHGLGWLMLVLFALIMLGLGLYLGGFRQNAAPPQEPVASVPEVVQPPQTLPTVPRQPQTQTLLESPSQLAPQPPLEKKEPLFEIADEPPAPPPSPARPISEMPSGFVANLPSINIDIHSYSEQPAKRYVLINMEKYNEGDYLAEGPQLIEILTDGVILEHLGERFIMPIGNQ
ncbi:MAG: general secretion pathway protein GspB [Chromatiales bacterium]|jgi:general secretion pathway protein B